MLKRLRTAHPILYCILAEVLFLGSLFLSSLVLTVALVAAGADFSGLDEYLLSLVQELVGAGAAWLLLRRTGRQVCRRHERTAGPPRQRLLERSAGGDVPAGIHLLQHIQRTDL